MKWLCKNCSGVVDEGVFGFRTRTSCPKCGAPESDNLSGMAAWARELARKTSGVACTFAVSHGHEHLSRTGYGLVDAGACAAIVAVWIKCYHGRKDLAGALKEFIRICSEQPDEISARQIMLEAKKDILKQQLKSRSDVLSRMNLAEERFRLQVISIDQRMRMGQVDEAAKVFLDHTKKVVAEDSRSFQEISRVIEAAGRQIEVIETGGFGWASRSRVEYGREQLEAAMDCVCRIGYYRLRIGKPNGARHVLGVIGVRDKDMFIFLDPNTGEFRCSSSKALKEVVNAHFTGLYREYTDGIEVATTK